MFNRRRKASKKYAVINKRSRKTMKTFNSQRAAYQYRRNLRQPKNHEIKEC
jgi:hypothetical protein